MKVIVLGAGMVGSAMALDLKDQYDVKVVDIDEQALKILKEKGMKTEIADLKDKDKLKFLISDFDLVVGAVPGFMGFETVKTCIESGKNIVDISFFPEDSLVLDKLAKEKGVIAITDIGVAPGMCNVLLGYHNERMKIDSYLCYVGGLPKKKFWPWEYKAPFSPCDVIEEYVRPARYKENGFEVIKPALSDPELLDFEECGTLEAWNSDGLRSLIKTLPNIPNMKEKTLRFPGHIEKARILRESGFFSQEPVEINGTKITPLQMTEKLLFSPKNWKLGDLEEEFTVMKIIIKGEENGIKKEYCYDLYDEFCNETNISSMARTTGYTCTAAVKLVADGIYTKKGLSPSEYLGTDEKNYDGMLNYLKERNIIYNKTVK